MQGADETHKLVMWRGKVKHCLKTAEGASTVELFSISAFVPEKLTEQMPPTLFVSALAGGLNFAVFLLNHPIKSMQKCHISHLESLLQAVFPHSM